MYALTRAPSIMRHGLLITTTGFALFAMFFGSGNLVFPVLIGTMVQGHYSSAVVGLALTGVLLPFLAVHSVIKNDGDYMSLFKKMGPGLSIFIPIILLSLLGPLGVVPRCITVAHGGLNHIIPGIPLNIFSAVMCAFIWLSGQNTAGTIDTIGKILTPILLSSLFLIVFIGVYHAHGNYPVDRSAYQAFSYSLFEGYQTMDLLAAFFFSTSIFAYLNNKIVGYSSESIGRVAFQSCLVAGGLLMLTYAAFIYLGAAFAPKLSNLQPQEYLASIAFMTLGEQAGIIIGLCIGVACLTTAMILTRVFIDFLEQTFPILNGWHRALTAISVVIAYFVSTFDFTGITKFLSPILTVLYPGLIVLTIAGLMNGSFMEKHTKYLVYAMWTFVAIFTYAI